MNEMPPQVDVAQLAEALKSGAALIDVREPNEFAEFRVASAVLIPLMTVPESVETISQIANGQPLYVICAAGGRSNRAAAFLREHGIDAINVAGGSNDWLHRGFPVETGEPDSRA
jgi:rhodanese-related sulfurtransferase